MIDDILEFNKQFVENKGYEKFITSKYPEKKLAILSCMDTRLVELLPASLGLKNGDVKLIKNAGGVVMHPFGSVMRSLLVAVLELEVSEIMVIGHTDCGIQHLDADRMIERLKERNVPMDHIEVLKYSGVNFNTWLCGFETVENSVAQTVETIENHPLMPKDVVVKGYVMDSITGELKAINPKEFL
ncbi:MAG: carbonic anhydrase [Lachnospiraceae bacterium]|nr:carbonic anhydrase [Lachnospiraceae bacterium]